VRHPLCVLYNSKQLGMLTLTVERNYTCYYIIGVYNNNMFRPLSQLLSASAQGVTYIILTDCIYSCPSLSNYTHIYILYITLYYAP